MASRRRNTILAGLDYLRSSHPEITLFQVISFLYICENEGLSIAELAEIIGTTRATASRNARSLTAADHDGTIAPSLGLVEIRQNEFDGRGRVLGLSPRGVVAREHLERLIALSTPISDGTGKASDGQN